MTPTEVDDHAATGVPAPCESLRCGHHACTIARTISNSRCGYCARPIGTDTPYQRSKAKTTLVHDACEQRFAAIPDRPLPGSVSRHRADERTT